MIVKNEEHVIVDTLTNILENIQISYWVISDTGSTDKTKELIVDFFKMRDIPGELVEHEWRDFAYNRNQAMKCAKGKGDYLFIFDADDRIHGKLGLPEVIDADQYMFFFDKHHTYERNLLLNNRLRWEWKGVLHECLSPIDPIQVSIKIDGDYYIQSGRSGSRNKNPNKYLDDAIVLKKAFYEEKEKDPFMAARYAFYCAQSYKDHGKDWHDDALTWYKKCLDLNNWNQEKYIACYHIGEFYEEKGDHENALKYLLKSIEYDSERIECIAIAMTILRNRGDHIFVNALYHRFHNYVPYDKLYNKLFLKSWHYMEHEIELNNSISAFYSSDNKTGYDCCKKIIYTNDTNTVLAIKNVMFYENEIRSDDPEKTLEFFYKVDQISMNVNTVKLWNLLFEIVRPRLTSRPNSSNTLTTRPNDPTIFLSFTTCKRWDLFRETVNSIFVHWTDISMVDYWYCVDDNSSEGDRKNMKENYPWITFYDKSPEEKGHRKSMNLIYDKLREMKPRYWIHIEDDFLFHCKMPYVTKSIEALEKYKDSGVMQVVFNRNYAETIEDYSIQGHESLPETTEFVLHHHHDQDILYRNCHYWPHYSFRPSMVNVSAIFNLGNFDSENHFFEMDYAKRWAAAGYKTAFFNRITHRHIGKLTSENDKPNAYAMNEEQQFNEICDCTPFRIENAQCNVAFSLKSAHEMGRLNEKRCNKDSNHAIKIVNLERRPDRKMKTTEILEQNGISSYEFIAAVDGKTLISTKYIADLFQGNDFGNRRGVIGCALSHYQLWQQLLVDETNSYYIIMEDDFTVCRDVKQKMDSLVPHFQEKDVVFLGYHMFEKERIKVKDIYDDEKRSVVRIEPLNQRLYIGGMFGYSINKAGAKKLVDYIQTNGIKHGIDYLVKIVDGLHSYECRPSLFFSVWNENGKNIDTDIQNMSDFMIFDEIKPSKYTFFLNVDQHDYDLYYVNKPLQELVNIADRDEKCVGFNTLGFFKSYINVEKLVPSKYFGKGDGIYVKTEYYEKIKERKTKTAVKRCKMICDWCSSEQLCKEWSNMCERDFCWKDIEITWENENIDYYVIINRPRYGEFYEPAKTIVFQMEPWVNDETKNWGVKTWGEWANPDPSKFLAVRGRKSGHHNNAFWQLELSLNDLLLFDPPQKKNSISSICSSKYFDEGHIARIDLLKYIEKKGDVVIDIYNQDNVHKFKNYKGPLTPYVDKSKGLVPYKYYFMIENNYETDFITEKLWEPILCETLVFYYGCPNVTDYINPMAYVLLDVNDYEKSYQIIKKAIREDWWSQRIDSIRQEKKRILNEMAFFPTLYNIILPEKRDVYNSYKKLEKITQVSIKKACFIHSCYTQEFGLDILCTIVDKVLGIDEIEKIFIINVGEKIPDTTFSHEKIYVIHHSDDIRRFEIDTINIIRLFCKYVEDCQILYLHTKGITYKEGRIEIFNGLNIHRFKCVSDWKNMMLYFLIDKHAVCSKRLETYDTVGCNHQEKPRPHYSGNFWWANSKYIKTLDEIHSKVRHDAEWWVLSDPSCKMYCIHNSGIDHYIHEYPPEKYT